VNQGFFSNSASTVPKKAAPTKKLDCATCGLYKTSAFPKKAPYGLGKKGILIIDESFDANNIIPLDTILRSLGVNVTDDCRYIGAINCVKSAEPKSLEIDCCRQRVMKEIEDFKPKVIIPLGMIAGQSLIGNRWHKDLGTIDRWRGWQIPDRDLKAWVCPTFHPNYIEGNIGNLSIVNTFKDDLKVSIDHVNKVLPTQVDERVDIIVCKTEEEALRWINHVAAYLPRSSPNWLSIDYETTGKKPQAKGHDIVSCAMSWYEGFEQCVAFEMTPKVKLEFTSKILKNPKIAKIAHGFKYEELWSRVILGTQVKNWKHCTQLASHVMDSRGGTSWLKFQAYVQFGLIDYDSHIEPFLEGADPDNANSINRVKEIPIQELLLYNGLDALLTLKLADKQMSTMQQWDGYKLLHDGSLAFVDLEEQGICVDVGYLNKQIKRIDVQEKAIIKKLEANKDIKAWKTKYLDKFNLFSPIQLKWLLFEHLKIKPLEFTSPTRMFPQGSPSISADSLEDYMGKATFIEDLVKLRKLIKVRDTFLSGILRETVDGKLHPFFKLNTVDSWRSSSTSPNAQNWPNRDKEMQKIIRSCLVPSPGNMLLETDYSGAEVRGAASHCKDPQLIKYITDPTTDMHRDVASDLFLLPLDQVTKPIRHVSKNGFVFPEFYGSYYKMVGPAIWKTVCRENFKVTLLDKEISLLDWLKSKGITSEKEFTNHVQRVEDDFWNKRFKVYGQWKEQTIDSYCTSGYMDTPTGFRIHGPLRRNQISNYSIQGSSFHLLLWSLTRLNEIGKREGWKSKIVSQIHDSLIYDLYPPEKEHIIATIKRVMCEEVRAHWPWVLVPLDVEMECTDVDGSWFTKKKVEE
jgi:uracil-DNA glycosylase family 4